MRYSLRAHDVRWVRACRGAGLTTRCMYVVVVSVALAGAFHENAPALFSNARHSFCEKPPSEDCRLSGSRLRRSGIGRLQVEPIKRGWRSESPTTRRVASSSPPRRFFSLLPRAHALSPLHSPPKGPLPRRRPVRRRAIRPLLAPRRWSSRRLWARGPPSGGGARPSRAPHRGLSAQRRGARRRRSGAAACNISVPRP